MNAPSALDLLGRWQLDPGILLWLLLLAAVYGIGIARVRRWEGWRTACFAGGLLTLAVALIGGVERYSGTWLSVHMAQHLLLTVVAPPLLLLGAPHVLALRALRGSGRAGLARLLGSRALSVLGRPVVAWSLFAAAMLGTHLTPLFALAVDHPLAHALEHVALLGAAVAFWAPVLGGVAMPHRLGALGRVGYLFAAMAPMGAVGAVFVSAGHPLFSAYAAAGVRDQALAGAVMWVGGGYVLLGALVTATWDALRTEERRQRARESYAGEGT